MNQEQSNADVSLEEATSMVNELPFPAAVVGESVKQFGYWFVLTESGWVPDSQRTD